MLLSFAQRHIDCPAQRYEFLLDAEHFDHAYAWFTDQELQPWADPQRTKTGLSNAEIGGFGVCLSAPAGHYLEQITMS
ncbi:hypothetical protein [Glutamicibacter arilaitensis]|uniref:hypothetical protein n=1 Tax=Glutamicibacter arilaitensis TaxID=256701 RepID=UPI0038510BA4